jgi:hypothetical protein
MDCDAAGRAAAWGIAGDLTHVGVTATELDLARGRDAGYDVTDWLATAGTLPRRLCERSLVSPARGQRHRRAAAGLSD